MVLDWIGNIPSDHANAVTATAPTATATADRGNSADRGDSADRGNSSKTTTAIHGMGTA